MTTAGACSNLRLVMLVSVVVSTAYGCPGGGAITPVDPPVSDPCAGVTCSGQGTCVVSGNTAACNCDVDYHAEGLTCVADAPVTPAPTVSLSANPTTVDSGGSSTVTWSSTNATTCTASGAWSGERATNGSEERAAISATSTFTLGCTGLGGSAERTVAVVVRAQGALDCGGSWPGDEETTTITTWPYRDCFVTNPVGARTRVTLNNGGEAAWEEGAGWNGENALRVRPPDGSLGRLQGYAGLGEHYFHAARTKRLNIRYLFRYNSNWAAHAQGTKWEIAIKYDYTTPSEPIRREGCERGMVIGHPDPADASRKVLTVEQGVCTQAWNVPNRNGWYYGAGIRENEWICLESEFDLEAGLYSTYITTQDGVYNQSLHTQIDIGAGEYGAPAEQLPNPNWWGSIDCSTGCFWGWPDDGGTVPRPSDTYIWYSHFAMSNSRIGPPSGFVQ